MKAQSAGQILKGAALFTIGSELTKKGIDVAKKKWNDAKQRRQAQRRQEDEEGDLKEKLDNE